MIKVLKIFHMMAIFLVILKNFKPKKHLCVVLCCLSLYLHQIYLITHNKLVVYYLDYGL